MKYNIDVFCHQYPIVKHFIQHASYYREITTFCATRKATREFWIATSDAHCLQAIILWCMVFGSDGCNQTHRKNLSPINQQKLIDDFRHKCFASLGLDKVKWNAYWNEFVTFRNEYAAHRAINSVAHVPSLELAIKVAHFYDGWIRELIKPDIFSEPWLTESQKNYSDEVSALVQNLQMCKF